MSLETISWGQLGWQAGFGVRYGCGEGVPASRTLTTTNHLRRRRKVVRCVEWLGFSSSVLLIPVVWTTLVQKLGERAKDDVRPVALAIVNLPEVPV